MSSFDLGQTVCPLPLIICTALSSWNETNKWKIIAKNDSSSGIWTKDLEMVTIRTHHLPNQPLNFAQLQVSLYCMFCRLSICKHKFTSNECVEDKLDNWFQFHRWHHICYQIKVDEESDIATEVSVKLYINALLASTGKNWAPANLAICLFFLNQTLEMMD